MPEASDITIPGSGNAPTPAISGVHGPAATNFEVGPDEAGKGGKEGGAPLPSFPASPPSNAEFVSAIFTGLPEGAQPIITAKPGDPEQGGWFAQAGSAVEDVCLPDRNTYVNCASFRPDDNGKLAARKEQAAAYHMLVLDDVGSKVDRALLGDIVPTWDVETSPGNHQVGFKLNPPLRDAAEVDRFQQRIAAAGLTDKGALGIARWVRLPNGINGKPKYAKDGKPFQCRLKVWRPANAFSAAELLNSLAPGQPVAAPNKPASARSSVQAVGAAPTPVRSEVYFPQADEHPVIAAFKEKGLYKRQIEPGKHEVTCPWVGEHTDSLDSGSAYFEPSATHPKGGFCCQHSHKDKYHIAQLLEHFGLNGAQARNKPLIRTVQGEMHTVVAAAEGVLAEQENIFQAGGLIVKASHDPMTGDWGIKPLTEAEITLVLSKGSDWEKYDKRAKGWERCDPPARHVMTLYKAERYEHLRPVVCLARQPYYRKGNGSLVTAAGYDATSQRLGVFDGSKFNAVGTTEAEARKAMALIDGLLEEFHFVHPQDRAAAFSAILTAAVRPGLDLAPAFHVKAPSSGSGKSYLCEVIAGFAGPGTPARMSYPKTSDEATKSIMAALLGGPAVIEFDDMDTDWLPHGSINRMLTSTAITDRILGHSKTATVSTNALVLGSGNNVGPIRDLSRRVVTINVNTHSATPGTITYKGKPVATLRAHREQFVMAALTIIEAWKAAGAPKTDVPSLASYGGDWADHCRHPLIWLGLPDPAANLIEQMNHDPEAELLGNLLSQWHRKHGDKPMTIRRLLDGAGYDSEIYETLCDLPVTEHGKVNRSKLGWYLKKQMNRIVGGFVLEQVPTSERIAWRVVKVEGGDTASPPSPPSQEPIVAIGGPEDAF